MRTSLSLLSLLLLAACGHQHAAGPGAHATSPPSQSYTVATGNDSGNSLAARLEGVLHGRVNPDKTACFWIEVSPKPGDKSSGPIAVMWPHGSRAVPNPLRVLGPDGIVVGRVGEDTVLGGGNIDSSALPLVGCKGFTTAFGG